MKIIDRYMFKGFVLPFLWCMFIFIVMAVIIDIFSFIDDIVKYKIPVGSLIAFYVYYCPMIFVQVTPMAALLSTIYLLSNLNKHNEIIAMKASGFSLWRIILPLLIMGFVLSGIVFMVNDKLIPISSKVSNLIRREELEKHRAAKHARILDNIALYGSGNRIIFARSYDTEKKTLEDIIIHEHDSNQNIISKTTASSAVWTAEGWKFNKAIIYNTDGFGRLLGNPSFFEEKIIPIKERPSEFANKELRAEFMSFRELKRYIANFRGAGARIVRSLLVELHYKVALSFISLVIILLGVPFAIASTRGGLIIGVGMSVVLGLLYYAAISVGIAFGKTGFLPPLMAAWMGNLVFAGIGIYLINKRG
jgi:lipopolysaccharide export system permease protein